MSKKLLISDAPPNPEGGGCHRLVWLLLQATPNFWSNVLTRLFYPTNPEAWREKAKMKQVLIGPDEQSVSRRLPGVLRYIIGIFKWAYFLDINRTELRMNAPVAIFAFFGADSLFSIRIWLAAKILDLPYQIYLVDDLEDWAVIHRVRSRTLFNYFFLRRFIHGAEKIYGISPGFCEKIKAQYGRDATWLPVALPPMATFDRMPIEPRICHVGSINALYLDALEKFVEALESIDTKKNYTLELLTSQDPDSIPKTLLKMPRVRIVSGLGGENLMRHLAGCFFNLIVYSDKPEVARMVRTSFPTKMTEALTCGRPLFVFVPDESSIASILREAGLGDTYATNKSLRQMLAETLNGGNRLTTDRLGPLRSLLNPAKALSEL